MTRVSTDEFVLSSSGRRFAANCGFIGLALDRDYNRWDVSEGYDGHIDVQDGHGWTAAERVELADYMIEQWSAFKAANTESR